MTQETSPTPVPSATDAEREPARRTRRNKVPEVILCFWIIKVLCTTVGETAADLLNEKAGLGLTGVSLLMSALLAAVLAVQFRTRACRAGVYWPAVALISVVGTLISDNLTDSMGVPLETGTTVFAIVLAVVFALWYRRERTLSIHHIDTTGRESFYWLAVLFTFALGLDAVWSFWIAYVLTRPLGASIGDYLSQPTGDGGLGLGTVVTSVFFLAVILGLVVYPAVTRKDVSQPSRPARHPV
ncbi:hypothetical protein AB0D38_30850 [Streptomyces sp. NPDC048279]|uniref:COG4705 family protein n=1 Tax=Streptomyces sp. NPDC048279 TaxID=3154714 RepID=UPI0034377EFC